MNTKKLFLILPFLLFTGIRTTKACTVFSAAKNGVVLAAANKDWDNINTRIKVIPPANGKYGIIYFGYRVAQGFQNVGGVNEMGLWYDGASLPERSDIRNHGNKPTVSGELCEKALEECATVDEVIALYQTYFTPHWDGHSMWADKQGNSVIIEYGEDDVVFVRKKKAFQVMTNFYVSDSANARWYNCYRYKVANRMLNEAGEMSIPLFRSILDAVHQEGATPTVYSTIYDLQNGVIYVFNFHNYDELAKLNVQQELGKGENLYKMPELFNQTRLISPASDEQVNPAAVTFKWMGNAESYELHYSLQPDFSGNNSIIVAESSLLDADRVRFASIPLALFFLVLLLFPFRKKIIIYGFAIVLLFLACSIDTITSPCSPSKIEHQVTVENLQPDTRYYWKVATVVDEAIFNESNINNFITTD